jgi:O-antigen/teichoic acid export membrane protein
MSRESNIGLIVKNAGIDTVGVAFNTVFMFAASVIITRTIGADLFGKYSLSNSIFLVLAVFAVFGLNTGVVKLTSKYNSRRDAPAVKGTLTSGIILTATFAVILTLAVIALAPHLAARVFSNVEGLDLILRVHMIALPFYALMMVIDGYSQGLKTLKYSVTVELVARPVIRLVAIVVLFLIGLRLFAVMFGTVFSYLLAAGLAFYFARRISPFSFSRTKTRLVVSQLFFYSLPLVFARFTSIIIGRANTILVGYFKDATSTGLFGAAATLSPFIALSLLSFGKIFAPVISELWEKGDTLELEKTFKTVSKWIFSLGFPLFLIFLLYARELLAVFGSEFTRADTTLRLLAAGQIVNATVGPVGYVLTMTGRQKLNLINSITLAGINIILSIVMIPRWGIVGAGLATAISLSLINGVRVVQVKMFYGFTPFRRDIFKPMLAGALTFGVFYLISLKLAWQGIAYTLALCGAFILVYIVLLFLFGLREEKQVLMEILRRRR